MKKPKSTEELAKHLEQESEDDELWEQEPVAIERRPSRTSVLSLRLPTTEFHALLQAARDSGETVSEYVRKAIVLRRSQQQEPAVTSVSVTYTGISGAEEQPTWRSYTSGNAQDEQHITRKE